MHKQSSGLESELSELFDIRKAKERRDKQRNDDAIAVQKDFKVLVMMFSDGVPNMTIPLGDNEFLEWDSRIKKLLYHCNDVSLFIENLKTDSLLKIKPHLHMLARKAKDFYSN